MLASEVTSLVHGKDAMKYAIGNTQAFFDLDVSSLVSMSKQDFESHFKYTDKEVIASDKFMGLDMISLLHLIGVRKTKADCRRLIDQNGL